MQASVYQSIEQRRVAPARCPNGRFEGRGIVICAGGERYFTCAWVLIFILRRVHCIQLPIQVWHLGTQEMSEEMRLLLEQEGIEVVNAETVAAHYPARLAGGWPLKPYAIAQSRFREVLYLDADTLPLTNPEVAFEWDIYRNYGLLLWPDIVDIKKTNPIWARLNLAPIDQASIDSGIMLVDKARAWDVLDLAVLMNENWEAIYDALYGDKDTFLISALLLKRPFGTIPYRPMNFEWDLVQRDPDGEPFLHHRTASKWLLKSANRPPAAPSLLPHCEAALADLRQRWSGHLFHPPARPLRARTEEARLISVGDFLLESSACATRKVKLLPGSCVSTDGCINQHWAVVERDNNLLLQFYRNAEPIVTLERFSERSWQGLDRDLRWEIRLKELSDEVAITLEGNGRVPCSAQELVAALAQPAFFAVGYDSERASALEAAFSLLNEAFDDVPEQISAHTVKRIIASQWRSFLDQLVARLMTARDRRLALVQREKTIGPRTLDPTHYARPV